MSLSVIFPTQRNSINRIIKSVSPPLERRRNGQGTNAQGVQSEDGLSSLRVCPAISHFQGIRRRGFLSPSSQRAGTKELPFRDALPGAPGKDDDGRTSSPDSGRLPLGELFAVEFESHSSFASPAIQNAPSKRSRKIISHIRASVSIFRNKTGTLAKSRARARRLHVKPSAISRII